MAGKTGTARVEYAMADWADNPRYISSFAGYFPADNPKYSCIVVIHKPSTEVGYYGADVSGPVFKRIAQKIYTDTPIIDELQSLEFQDGQNDDDYNAYIAYANKYKTIMPDLRGMSAMDALSLLENMDVEVNVELRGSGVIKKQSVAKNKKLKSNQTVVLEAS